MAFSRGEILRRLREQVAARKPIIGCGAGTGISAKFAEAGGADLLIIYNSGRYRMAGRSSLAGFFAYGDANSIVMEMAGEVLPVVRNTPVLAGVNGTDPFKVMPHFLQQVKAIGFSGVQNFPTMGMFDGIMRANMEATGLGYDKEVAMIRMASEIDLFTSPYVFNADEARAMVQAGADLIVCHVGLTTAGSIGASVAMTLDEAVEKTMVMAEAVWKLRKDALVICHGGPFDEPENVKKALKQMPGIAGFYGASSVER
ncbi:phosphoenolpyruvate hydrolase family protein, partial [Anaerolineae bacterium CFX9]|nr:phosphoenolpyruvate hydrolase family protein [Anaerolineae bacterium CFX9]